MSTTIRFKCLACEADYPADRGTFICPDCGANLEVQYAFGALDRDRISARTRHDIFRYHEWLPVDFPEHVPSLRIGGTPLYRAQRLGEQVGFHRVYLKDEGLNPSGSFKDRATAVVVSRALADKVEVVAAASTGNAGSSLACLGANCGIRTVVCVPENAPEAKMTQLQIFGAEILAVRGTYDDAYDLCARLCREHGWLNRNTGFNPFTREGKKTAAFELCEQFDWDPPEWVVVPVGDGNIISGLWKGFVEMKAVGFIDRLPRLVCAQAEGSAAIVQALEGLGPDFSGDWTTVKVAPFAADTVADSVSVDDPRDGLAAVRAVIESDGLAE
ncbi:MAG: threonine synthase, partial [Verrucomicrobiota bacterium]